MTDDQCWPQQQLSQDVRPWLLLWNFAPVLVWNFCGDCLTTHDHGFCCETFHQFWCNTFAVIVWRHTTMSFAVKLCTSPGVKLLRWLSDHTRPWLLLWNFAPVLLWSFCGDCLTTHDHMAFAVKLCTSSGVKLFAVIVWPHTTMAFAVKLCTSSGVKLLRWLSDHIRPWLLLWNFAPVLVSNVCGDCRRLRLETIVVEVSLGRLSFRANACNKSLFRKMYVRGLSSSGQI